MLWFFGHPTHWTILRIALIPFILIFFYLSEADARIAYVALALFALAAVSDYIDGKLARGRKMESAFGAELDLVADKLLTIFVLIAFVERDYLSLLPALFIIGREVLVMALRGLVTRYRVALPVTQVAKWKTAVQFVSFGPLMLGALYPDRVIWGEVGVWIAVVLTVYTGYQYAKMAYEKEILRWV